MLCRGYWREQFGVEAGGQASKLIFRENDLGCGFDVASAGLADELDAGGKERGIENNCKVFGYHNWCPFIEMGKMLLVA